jgi:hypothetical protein
LLSETGITGALAELETAAKLAGLCGDSTAWSNTASNPSTQRLSPTSVPQTRDTYKARSARSLFAQAERKISLARSASARMISPGTMVAWVVEMCLEITNDYMTLIWFVHV